MKKWTIKRRIITGFAIILALVTLLTVTSFTLLRQAREAVHALAVEAMPGMDAMSQIYGTVGDGENAVLRDLLAQTPGERQKIRAGIAAGHDLRDKMLADFETTLRTSEDRELFEKFKAARAQYNVVRNQILDLVDAGKNDAARQLYATGLVPVFDQYKELADQELKLNLNHANRETAQTVATTDLANGLILGISITVVILGVVIGLFITGGLNRVLRQLALSLNDGSAQVVSAAAQVSASSQSLAEGASEQAASLEETSSSLEEMAGMTRRNSENSQKADELAKQARSAADRGVGDMQAMSTAMAAIKTSSDDIAKIIKTIDEIAFQTNILALNAAVEAARAGEAGMGFAVVADEVRNLAQRSAEAARETAAKIEGAITRSAQGAGINRKVAEVLDEIVIKARQVDELVAEVAGASQEQTQGITQINLAVGQMDKVTQSNAANAEESAAAAEELNAQAEAMKEFVTELLQLVGGGTETTAAPAPAGLRPALRAKPRPAPAHPPGRGKSHARPRPEPSGATPDRAEIPMVGDFKDF